MPPLDQVNATFKKAAKALKEQKHGELFEEEV